LNLRFETGLLCFGGSEISNLISVVTGHGPFKVHLQKLQLTDEIDCPKCVQDKDTALHFVTSCQFYKQARLRTLGQYVLKGAAEPTCITVSVLLPIHSYFGAF
jgi:hypothetical protein